MSASSNKQTKNIHLSDLLWDLWCLVSIVGIWPRYIEPNLLSTTRLSIKIANLPTALNQFKILQFSDLHLNSQISASFLKRLARKIRQLSPDLIVFTGDFICCSQLKEKEHLKSFLSSLKAPYGCYASLGNHDYDAYVSVNEAGDYDVREDGASSIKKGLKRLFLQLPLTKTITARARNVPLNEELLALLKQTPFKLLHNISEVIPIKDSALNLCGLGEYTLGRCQPEIAFKNYDPRYPGIVLSHNPDSIALLKDYPGDLLLCGHTHGGEVNLPGIVNALTLMENPELKRGLKTFKDLEKNREKLLYINRGIGSEMPFRWFALPELSLFTLEDA